MVVYRRVDRGAGVRGERGGKQGEQGREVGREARRGREVEREGAGSGERGGGKQGLDTPLSTHTIGI